METNLLNLNNIYINNNNLLLEIIKELKKIINNSNDNVIIKSLSKIIEQLYSIINDNRKNNQIILNYVNNLQNQIEQMNNKISNREIKYENKRYVGQVINEIKEGKGIIILELIYFPNFLKDIIII